MFVCNALLISQSEPRPMAEPSRFPPLVLPFLPHLRGTLSIEGFFAHGLLESLCRMAQRPRDALAQLWFVARLHGKVRRVAVSDGGGPNEYGGGEPKYGLDAAGLATGEEAVHAHRAVAGLARCAGVVRVPGPGPGNVAVGVVAQLERGGLCVRLCFEERASGRRALRERGGEEGGERVREQGFHFWGVQHRLDGVVENEYDYGRHEYLAPGEKRVEDAQQG